MPATYDSLATVVTSGSASTVTMNSISQSFTDLFMVMDFSLSSNAEVYVRFNNDSSALYSRIYWEGNGGSVTGNQQNGIQQVQILGRTTRMVNLFNIARYTASQNKTVVARFSSGIEIVGTEVALYRSSTAISRIDISLSAGTFTDGSVITLYGILAA